MRRLVRRRLVSAVAGLALLVAGSTVLILGGMVPRWNHQGGLHGPVKPPSQYPYAKSKPESSGVHSAKSLRIRGATIADTAATVGAKLRRNVSTAHLRYGDSVQLKLSHAVSTAAVWLRAPFRCPRQTHSEPLADCVQVFVRGHILVARLKHVRPVNNYQTRQSQNVQDMKKRRETLAKMLASETRTPGELVLHALKHTYSDLPILAVVDESSSDHKSDGSRSFEKMAAWSGTESYRVVCDSVVGIRTALGFGKAGTDSRQNPLLVVFGTHKGAAYYHLFLAGLVAFDTLMLASYLNFESSVKAALFDLNSTNLALAIPPHAVDRACKLLLALLAERHLTKALLIILMGGKKAQIVSTPQCKSGTIFENNTHMHASNVPVALFHRLGSFRNHQDALCTGKSASSPVLLVARMNGEGNAELVNMNHSKILTKMKRLSLANLLAEMHAAESSLPIFNAQQTPMSSGDCVDTVIQCLLFGFVFSIMPLNYGHYESIANHILVPSILTSTPVQFRMLQEEHALEQAFARIRGNQRDKTRDKNAAGSQVTSTFVQRRTLQMCNSGGGSLSPSLAEFLMTAQQCPALRESWGSYESLTIGDAQRRRPKPPLSLDTLIEARSFNFDSSSIKNWRVIPFGGYVPPFGELLIQPRVMNSRGGSKISQDKFQRERLVVDEHGKSWLRTREVVKVLSRTPPGTVALVDKTHGGATRIAGKFARKGLVERAIEGDQTIVQNAVVFADPITSGASFVAVVFPADASKNWTTTNLLRYVQQSVQKAGTGISFKHRAFVREIPQRVIVADQPWEFAPRFKIRNMLERVSIGLAQKNRSKSAAEHATGLALNRRFTRLARREVGRMLGSAGECDSLCEAMLGCVAGSCLLFNSKGKIREPSLRLLPFDPREIHHRETRFDNEPFNLWTRRTALSSGVSIAARLLQFDMDPLKKYRLQQLLPLVLPSLGLLLPFGIRLRMRFDCAIRIAKQEPELYDAQTMTFLVWRRIMAICRGFT